MRRFAAVSAGLITLLLICVSPASATTWCVPEFHTACPDNDSNVQEPSLQFAMESQGNDGVPDRIVIAPGELVTTTGSITPDPLAFSNDPLEIVGAGADSTRLTWSVAGNIYLLNFASGDFAQRKVTMRDLSIVIPPPTGMSASAIQTEDDVFERVNFESQDATLGGGGAELGNIIGGGVFRDVKVFGTGGGRFSSTFGTGNAFPGDELEITDTTVSDAGSGVVSNFSAVLPVHIKRSHFQVDGQVLNVQEGETSTVENSIIEAGEFPPFYTTTAGSGNATLNLRNNTIVSVGGADTAISSTVGPAATGSASTVISDSIIVGFDDTWELEAPVSGSLGDANLNLSYSNVSSSGTKVGDGTVTATQGVINETPLFEGFNDFRLTPDSPSIDAGNPAAGGLIEDFEGNVRPLDGDGDGTAVRDQGAYEAPKLATCANTPSLCPVVDETAPKITKVKFKAPTRKKAGALRLKLSEAGRIKAVFKPTPAKKKGQKKRKTVKLARNGKAGANKLIIKKGKLKPGKYRLTLTAIDDSGNKSKPVVKRVKVKR